MLVSSGDEFVSPMISRRKKKGKKENMSANSGDELISPTFSNRKR